MHVLATAFRLASRLRGARVFHPRGHLFHATWTPDETGVLLQGSPLMEGPRDALLRISHAIGLPAGVPDIVGLAVKVLDVHGPELDQDVLLASSGSSRLGRHLLVPTRAVTDTVFSTLLPYDVGGVERDALVARSLHGSPVVTYASLAAGRTSPPVFELRVGAPDGTRLATVAPSGPASDEAERSIRFDPWHTGPALRPVGWANRIRRPTYQASQKGRDAPHDGWRATQDHDGRR